MESKQAGFSSLPLSLDTDKSYFLLFSRPPSCIIQHLVATKEVDRDLKPTFPSFLCAHKTSISRSADTKMFLCTQTNTFLIHCTEYRCSWREKVLLTASALQDLASSVTFLFACVDGFHLSIKTE